MIKEKQRKGKYYTEKENISFVLRCRCIKVQFGGNAFCSLCVCALSGFLSGRGDDALAPVTHAVQQQ